VNRPADRSHAPELDDLDLAVYRIRHRTEKAVNRNIVSGLFHDFLLSGVDRVLASVELALRQDQDLSRRIRTMAIRRLDPFRNTIPPDARIGARSGIRATRLQT
jgi:hypothetical protein